MFRKKGALGHSNTVFNAKVVRVFRAMKMLKYITQQLSKLLAVYIVVLIMILLVCTPLLEYDEVSSLDKRVDFRSTNVVVDENVMFAFWRCEG